VINVFSNGDGLFQLDFMSSHSRHMIVFVEFEGLKEAVDEQRGSPEKGTIGRKTWLS